MSQSEKRTLNFGSTPEPSPGVPLSHPSSLLPESISRIQKRRGTRTGFPTSHRIHLLSSSKLRLDLAAACLRERVREVVGAYTGGGVRRSPLVPRHRTLCFVSGFFARRDIKMRTCSAKVRMTTTVGRFHNANTLTHRSNRATKTAFTAELPWFPNERRKLATAGFSGGPVQQQ